MLRDARGEREQARKAIEVMRTQVNDYQSQVNEYKAIIKRMSALNSRQSLVGSSCSQHKDSIATIEGQKLSQINDILDKMAASSMQNANNPVQEENENVEEFQPEVLLI